MEWIAASILLANPGPIWIERTQPIPEIPRHNVAIPNIQITPPIQMAAEVRPIRIWQATEIYIP